MRQATNNAVYSLYSNFDMPQTILQIPLKPNSKDVVSFDDTSIDYDGVRIPYNEVVGVSFYTYNMHATLTDKKTRKLMVRSQDGKKIAITMRAIKVLFIGNSLKFNYDQIVEQILNRIGPGLLERLVRQILTPGNIVRIGSFSFDADGITYVGAFGSVKRAEWQYHPGFHRGVKPSLLWKTLLLDNSITTGIFPISYLYPPTGKMVVIGEISSKVENGIFVPQICIAVNSILHG